MKKTVLYLSLFLAGCTVGPDYQQPDIGLPAGWLSAAVVDDHAAVQENWWKHFNDPVLDQLIQKASAGNFDLKVAEARIAQARAAREAANGNLLPTINTGGSAERQANRIAFPGPIDLTKPFNLFQAGFDASWELDLFGGTRREIEADTATLTAAVATRDDVRISLLAEVARTYVDIRNDQAQLALTNETIESQQHTLAIAEERFKAGVTAGVDVTSVRAQLEQAQTEWPHYQNMLAQAEFSMDVLLGEQPGATHALVADAKPIPVADSALVLAAPAKVIANRPDIRMAERQLAAATAGQGVATAQLFPDVSLSGFLGLLNVEPGNFLKSASKSWDVAGNVTWPILNYSKLTAAIDLADAKQQEALAQYQKSIVAALSDVEKSLTAYNKQQEYRESLNKEVADNHKAADIAQERYQQGLTSFVEVLESQRTLYASQSKLADADAQGAQDLAAVYKSLGGGWENTPLAQAAP